MAKREQVKTRGREVVVVEDRGPGRPPTPEDEQKNKKIGFGVTRSQHDWAYKFAHDQEQSIGDIVMWGLEDLARKLDYKIKPPPRYMRVRANGQP